MTVTQDRVVHSSSSTALPRRGPLPLRDVVAELLDDHDLVLPASHRCVLEGPNRCRHESMGRRPLLRQILDTGMDSGSLGAGGGGGSSSGVRAGSPAPYRAEPVEFVDGVYRQALRYSTRLRELMDFGPLRVHRAWVDRPLPQSWHPPLLLPMQVSYSSPATATPIELAGPAALRDLPVLLEMAAELGVEDPLVYGPLVKAADRRRGRGWGLVERTVRRWHREALIMTGHRPRRVILHELANPLHGWVVPGPSCEEPWRCGHDTCTRAWMSTQPRFLLAVCPFCNAVGFPVDEDQGVIRCDNPACVDDEGARHEWSMDAFTAGFDRLALTPTEEAACSRIQ